MLNLTTLRHTARHGYVTVSPTERIVAKYHDTSVPLAEQLEACVPAPTQLHVNMTQLVQNWKALQSHAGPSVIVAPTLKAEAYGHGAVATATVLQAAGAQMFMVAALREAVALAASRGPSSSCRTPHHSMPPWQPS